MTPPRPGWLELARSPAVVRRGLCYAAVVGPVLIAINQGDVILAGGVQTVHLLKMLLTLAVPYAVSTLSSVAALRAQRAADEERRAAGGGTVGR